MAVDKMQPDLGQVSAHLWALLGVKTSQTWQRRETGCQDQGKGGRRESRERRMNQSFWKIKSCVPFQVEWNQNREWRGDGSMRAGRSKHPKRVCRDVGVPSTIFYFCLFHVWITPGFLTRGKNLLFWNLPMQSCCKEEVWIHKEIGYRHGM